MTNIDWQKTTSRSCLDTCESTTKCPLQHPRVQPDPTVKDESFSFSSHLKIKPLIICMNETYLPICTKRVNRFEKSRSLLLHSGTIAISKRISYKGRQATLLPQSSTSRLLRATIYPTFSSLLSISTIPIPSGSQFTFTIVRHASIQQGICSVCI